MSAHTPGPWQITCARNREGAYNDIGAPANKWPNSHVALVTCSNPDYRGNCALISAAPDLLEWAEKVLAAYMPQFNDSRAVDDVLVGLAAAVAKATE